MKLFDINTVAEDVLAPIFRIVFNSPNLCNQNRIQMNYPAVDLGCKTSKISIQITSDPSSKKVIKTLQKFKAHNLDRDFDSLYVYVITEKQLSYSSNELAGAINRLPITFDASNNILDFKDLARKLGNPCITNQQIQQINEHLKAEFTKADTHLQFRSNLDAFLNVSQQKIEVEKQTKKYIPTVFVETSETKENMRYFANPMFFYRKIDDDLRRMDLAHFNKLLRMAKIEPITDNLREALTLDAPNTLHELMDRLEHQGDVIRTILTRISPFSWYGESTDCFIPNDELTGYWDVFRHSIQENGNGLFRSLEKVYKKLEIAQSKIFLVTGMAGQGKTNFICDLIEKQFRVFKIPTIFIPARSLNNYPSPNRILSYIKNNRFSPDVDNIQDLLSLLNKVAAEKKSHS